MAAVDKIVEFASNSVPLNLILISYSLIFLTYYHGLPCNLTQLDEQY